MQMQGRLEHVHAGGQLRLEVVVAGTGFLLNNEMGDFNSQPGETNAAATSEPRPM